MAHVDGTVVCRLCLEHVTVKFRRAPGNVSGGVAVLLMDVTPLQEHVRKCEPVRDQFVLAPKVPQAELTGRIEQMLNGRHYIAAGASRACTMCGVTGQECMDRLNRSKKPCCPLCGDGNTHPAPGEAVGSCAQWAAEHGAQS